MIEQLTQPGQPVENPAAFKYTSPQGKEELVAGLLSARIHGVEATERCAVSGAHKSQGSEGVLLHETGGVDSARTPDQMAASESLMSNRISPRVETGVIREFLPIS